MPGLVVDLDASLVTCHSEKEQTAATFKHGLGYHPMLAWLDNTDEALAGMLRPGNAGSNNAADHIQVTDEALGQIPDEHRHGTPILVRSDSAGGTREWLAHLRGLRDQQGLQVSFSVGFRVTNQVKDAIGRLPESAWTVAVDAAGEPRPVDETGLPVAPVAELTGLLGLTNAGWPRDAGPGPPGTTPSRRPDQPDGSGRRLALPMCGDRHPDRAAGVARGAAPRPRPGRGPHQSVKQTGMGRFPSREFAINQAWLQLAITAADLIAWTQTTLLDAVWPRPNRRSCATGCCTPPPGSSTANASRIKIDAGWPWAAQLAAAFNRLAEIRQPLII